MVSYQTYYIEIASLCGVQNVAKEELKWVKKAIKQIHGPLDRDPSLSVDHKQMLKNYLHDLEITEAKFTKDVAVETAAAAARVERRGESRDHPPQAQAQAFHVLAKIVRSSRERKEATIHFGNAREGEGGIGKEAGGFHLEQEVWGVGEWAQIGGQQAKLSPDIPSCQPRTCRRRDAPLLRFASGTGCSTFFRASRAASNIL